MKRIVTAILAAAETFGIATAGLAIIAIPVLLVWLVSYGLQGEPAAVFGLIADAWFFGHGVPLGIEIDAPTAAALGLPPAALTATFSLFPLGFMLFTAGSAARMGKRLATLGISQAAVGALVATVTLFLMAWMLASVAPRPPLQFDVLGSAFMPTLVFAVGLGVGFLIESIRSDSAWLSDLRHGMLERVTESRLWLFDSVLIGVRIASFTLAALVALAALIFALRVTVSYVGVVSLSQQLQLDWVGILVMFLVNLAYLPTLLVWTLSWMIGPGFSIGAGSSVSALSTELGPIPSVPIFGVLPTGEHPWGLAIVSLVLVSAIIATVGVLREVQFAGEQRPTIRQFAAIGLTAALSSGLAIAAAVWMASGSLGPGRLEITGPNTWLVAGVGAAEILFGVLFGAWLSTVDWDRLATSALERTEPFRQSRFASWISERSAKTPPTISGADALDTQSDAPQEAAPDPSVSGSTSAQANDQDTVELSDFTPWWSEKDDKL